MPSLSEKENGFSSIGVVAVDTRHSCGPWGSRDPKGDGFTDSITILLHRSSTKQHFFFFLQGANHSFYVCRCLACVNPFILNDKIHIGILGEKIAVWLALSIDVKIE